MTSTSVMAPPVLHVIGPEDVRATECPVELDLPDDQLVTLYETMVVTRLLDQELINLQRQGELALYPSCRGQEAAQVGSVLALSPDDWVFPQYRELGVFVGRGIDPLGVALMWRGVVHGGVGLVEHHSAPLAVPIATHAPHAVGMALGAVLAGGRDVSVAYIGDGATSEGDAHEAFNIAAVLATPCIFFVQNNQWAISVPLEEQTRSTSIAAKAVAYGMPGIRCDGNDVLACLAATRRAVEYARSGRGPTLIEAVTYRMEGHTTADDPRRYRSQEEVERWRELDPIARYESFLGRAGLWSDDLAARCHAKGVDAAASLRRGVTTAPLPDPAQVFDLVFAVATPELRRQAAQLVAEQHVRT